MPDSAAPVAPVAPAPEPTPNPVTIIPASSTPEAAPPKVMLAGKYETPEMLAKGMVNLLGLKDTDHTKLIGNDGQFKTVEEAERAYKFLESNRSKIAVTKDGSSIALDGTMKIADAPATPTGDDETSGVVAILEKASLDPHSVGEQWKTAGKLTDEQYAAIRKVNPALSKGAINDIARGLYASEQLGAIQQQLEAIQQQQIFSEAAKMVGSEEALKLLLATAGTFVPEDELEDIQKRLLKPKSWKGAMRDVLEHKAKALGTSGNQIISGTSQSSGGASITTFAELKQLEYRVRGGDKAAIAMYMSLPDDIVSKLK